ncbi:DUF2794 domain-containing protein [Aestuariispira insulae]|uniref:Uncharacterized protein DUF2794 n=1 Tax=Aestuariispira insulae TaxID=1461337 RepID=A0A3D9HVQ7_9PROT|nr:DUF2794 domain-containing protein [Aestuariispira insulae]RED53578.1 uncharacterized protein DUF2794 [Aestuariispira insulae]
MNNLVDLSNYRQKGSKHRAVFFSKEELRSILDLYSRHVADGEWKDYAIDHQGPVAGFSVFRHSFDRPLLTIGKRRNGKHEEFFLTSNGRTIKRSRHLGDLLKYLSKPMKLIKLP